MVAKFPTILLPYHTKYTYLHFVVNLLPFSFQWQILVTIAKFSSSAITQIVSLPFLVLGNLVTKSIVINSHFQIGISNCCNKPEGFWCSALTCEQVKHLET
ncbi:hypothetical protein Hanom_Chr03g00251601 [Helianthus anomalus]